MTPSLSRSSCSLRRFAVSEECLARTPFSPSNDGHEGLCGSSNPLTEKCLASLESEIRKAVGEVNSYRIARGVVGASDS